MAPPRVIVHCDMDAFYAAVEQRDNPALRGKPVIVGGPERRGVVSTCSYEARPFGVHSAMPMARALKLCPDAIVVPGRMQTYVEASKKIMSVFDDFSPHVEPLSLDEAFLDMTGCEEIFGSPREIGRAIKDRIREETELTASVGLASNKFLAKLASDLEKPDGLTWIRPGEERTRIAPLGIRRIWGVGPKAAAKLQTLGLDSIGQVADADSDFLIEALGPNFARHIQSLARGLDNRRVVGGQGRKSIGSETTLQEDVRGRDQIEKVLRRQCERVAAALRKKKLLAGSVRVKVRYSRTFKLATRQAHLRVPADDSVSLLEAGSVLLDSLDLHEPIRLVGAAAFDFVEANEGRQIDLFDKRPVKNTELESTLDSIRAKFGRDVIGRGED